MQERPPPLSITPYVTERGCYFRSACPKCNYYHYRMGTCFNCGWDVATADYDRSKVYMKCHGPFFQKGVPVDMDETFCMYMKLIFT